jgi:hypothetical protein
MTSVDFGYEDDYGVNDNLISTLLSKMHTTDEVLDPTLHQDDLHRTANHLKKRLHLGKKEAIFKAVHDKAVVTFFDKEEYREENLRVIRKEWESDHVTAFLRST